MFKSDQIQRKFIEVHETSDWDVWTDSGWQPIESSNKTIRYRKYILTTESGKTLECADDHIIFDETYTETYAKDATGRLIQTVDGLDRVLSVTDSGVDEHMYDLSVDSEDHRFYSNGILSHNSTVIAAYISWLVLFSPAQRACVLANNMTTAKEIFGRLQFMIENCPKWLQQGIREWNKTSFVLENKSSAFCAATSPSSIRGQSVNFILLDEFAHLGPNLAEEFMSSAFPTLSSSATSQMVIVSTPKGMNHYYKLWKEAESGINGFFTVSSTWREHPNRDQAWADDQLKQLGQLKYNQEVECVVGDTMLDVKIDGNNKTIKIEDLTDIDPKTCLVLTPSGFQPFDFVRKTITSSTIQHLFDDGTSIQTTPDHRFIENGIEVLAIDVIEELNGKKIVSSILHNDQTTVYDLVNVSGGNVYLTNGIISHNCEFLGSSSTLINGPTIAAIPMAHTEEIFEGYREYHQPIEKHSYIIVSDVARGAELDYSAFLVIDVTELPYKISAVFRNNKIDPQMYPEVIHRIAKKYNEAFVLIETNDIGQQVADILFYDLEYENVYMSFREKINEGQGKKIPGLRTTKKTKAHGCSQLKTLIENNMIEINDYNIIDEMSVFVRVGTSYKAEEGKTDDLMMCLVMFAYLTQQSIFKELFDFSLREVYLRNQRIEWEEWMEPIGFVDRGEVPLTLPHGQNYIEATESWADFPML